MTYLLVDSSALLEEALELSRAADGVTDVLRVLHGVRDLVLEPAHAAVVQQLLSRALQQVSVLEADLRDDARRVQHAAHVYEEAEQLMSAAARALAAGVLAAMQMPGWAKPSVPRHGPVPLHQGDVGAAVLAVQKALGRAGWFTSGDKPGTFGPDTERAVRQYQAQHGLPVTGVVDAATRASLLHHAPAQPRPVPVRPGDTGPRATAVIDKARQYLGTPYRWGGNHPGGFDCSGLVQYVYGSKGVHLPRVAADQQRAAHPVSEPRAGDLVFFGRPAHHVGIYLGNGLMLDAPHTGAQVRVEKVWDQPHSYGRVL